MYLCTFYKWLVDNMVSSINLWACTWACSFGNTADQNSYSIAKAHGLPTLSQMNPLKKPVNDAEKRTEITEKE